MANEYFTPSGWPSSGSKGSSASARAEFELAEDGFDKFPTITAKANEFVSVKTAETGLESITAAAAKTLLDLVLGTNVQAHDVELVALATPAYSANEIPMFTGSGTASTLAWLDQDTMVDDSATAVVSQQSIKAYVDGLYDSNLYTLDGPSGTRAFFYNTGAPTGWTLVSALDNRAVFIHATTGGTTVGTNAPDGAHATNTQSASHTHTLYGTATTSFQTHQYNLNGPGTQVASDHNHLATINLTSSIQDTSHSHTFSAFLGVYCVLCNKT